MGFTFTKVWRGCFLALWVFVCAGVSLGGDETALRRQRTEPHMGTQFTIVLYAADEAAAERAMDEAFARIAELDQRLSDYRTDSEVNRLCATAPHVEWVEVSDDLWHMLSTSKQLSQRSEGAFDVTVGPLTKLWRRARRQRAAPPADQLAEARSAVGYRFIELDMATKRVRLLRPDMRIDFGGIAKGYAAQQAGMVLDRQGISQWLVDAGGDLSVGDPPPDATGWHIGVAALQADQPPSRWLLVRRASVATSGDFWQYIEIDGQRYSHILDPHTGMGVIRRSSVTVIAPSGELADALASALSVLGPEKGLQLAQSYEGVDALILIEESGMPAQYDTHGFAAYLTEPPQQRP